MVFSCILQNKPNNASVGNCAVPNIQARPRIADFSTTIGWIYRYRLSMKPLSSNSLK